MIRERERRQRKREKTEKRKIDKRGENQNIEKGKKKRVIEGDRTKK